jgi:hypothetical protein
MGVGDAANLLIGVNTVTKAAEAPKLVRVYRNLEAVQELVMGDRSTNLLKGTLGDAIEQLLDAIGKGELPDRFLGKDLDDDPWRYAFATDNVIMALKFRITTPFAFLGITFNPSPDIATPDLERLLQPMRWHLSFCFYPQRGKVSAGKAKSRVADRVEEVTVGYPTLSAVGRLLRS